MVGEEKAYLDIDHVGINPVTILEKWESDIPNQNHYSIKPTQCLGTRVGFVL